MGEPVRPGADPVRPAESGEFDAQLAHLFDYCLALLGGADHALAIARSVLTSEQGRPGNPDRRRAILFALARGRAVAMLPAGTDEPPYEAPAAVASGEQPGLVVLSAFGALTYRDREILDLVYRHRIRPADLPGVLAIPAEEAYRRLVNAEEEFISLTADPDGNAGADLDRIADLPLAALPAPWGDGPVRRRQPGRAVMAAGVWRALARRRVQLATAAVIAVAAIAWGVVYLAQPGHPGGSSGAAILPGSSASSASQAPSEPNPTPAARTKRAVPPVIPIALLLPGPGRSVANGVTLPPPLVSPPASPSPSLSPSLLPSPSASPSPSVSPSPSPSPTESASPPSSPAPSPSS